MTARYCASQHGASGPPGAAGSEPGWLINREEVERKLRSLGYVQ